MATVVHRELADFQALSEFPRVPQDSPVWYNDACFVAALVPGLAAYGKAPLTVAEVTKIRTDMRSHGLWDSVGTDMSKGEVYARTVLGLQTVYPPEWHWSTTRADAIHAGLIAQAGINALVLQLDRAGLLPGNEAGIRSHFVGIGGLDSVRGYLVANGDDVLALAANNGHGKIIPTRWMTWAQIAAAVPTSLMAIMHPVKPSTVGTPQGWTDDGTTLTAPNGRTVVHGFRAYILASGHWDAADVPLLEEQGDAGQSFQVFAKSLLQWTPQSGVTVEAAGPMAHIVAAKAA